MLFVVVSSIFVMISVVALWAHHTVFDTDAFMETIEPVLQDPALNQALADYVTDEVTGALALEQRLEEPLANLDAYLSAALLALLDIEQQGQDFLGQIDRPTLEALAGPIADRFNERIANIVHRVIESPEVTELIPQVIRRAHEGSVALIRGDLEVTPNVSIEGGDVRLNTLPIVARVLQPVAAELRQLLPDLNLPTAVSDRVDEAIAQFREALGDRVPDDFGQITVMSEDRLTEIQDSAEVLDRWVWGAVVLTVLLLIATIWVSPTRRRTIIQLGIGVAVAFLIAFLFLRRLETAVVEQIASPEGNETAAGILEQVLAGLRGGIIAVIVIAALIAIGFYIAGRPEWVSSTGQRVAGYMPGNTAAGGLDGWVAAHYDIVRIVLGALALLALFLIGVDWLPVIIIAAVLALALWWLARARDRATERSQIPVTDSDPII